MKNKNKKENAKVLDSANYKHTKTDAKIACYLAHLLHDITKWQ